MGFTFWTFLRESTHVLVTHPSYA
jgi:CheY-like chemotaxis protein